MTLALMVYGVLVSAVLAAGAALAERLVRSTVAWTRFLWASALASSLVLLAAAPGRVQPPVDSQARGDASPTADVGAALDLPMSVASRTAQVLPAWSSRGLGFLWTGASLLTAALLVASYRRHRRRIAHGRPATVDGTAVRVTDSLGPAVIGVRRPEIVVPRWLLARPLPEQVLVVRHERSHVEAGDPALLLAACAFAAAQPWNPVAWYMVARLRLAIEMDCDRRVLRAGAPARDYGALLIELTSAIRGPSRASATASFFASRPSHLERRLVAMTARPAAHRRARLLAAASVAALAFVAACEAALPTAAELDQMDAAEVEERVIPGLKLDPASVTYYVDGVAVDRSVAMEVAAERIVGVEIVRKAGDSPRIHLLTKDDPNAKAREIVVGRDQSPPAVMRKDGAPPFVTLRDGVRLEGAPGSALPPKVVHPSAKPVMLLDGVLVTPSELSKVAPEKIENVMVRKGEDAKRVYGAGGADGVIEVTTKQGAGVPINLLEKVRSAEVEGRKIPLVEVRKSPAGDLTKVKGEELKKP